MVLIIETILYDHPDVQFGYFTFSSKDSCSHSFSCASLSLLAVINDHTQLTGMFPIAVLKNMHINYTSTESWAFPPFFFFAFETRDAEEPHTATLWYEKRSFSKIFLSNYIHAEDRLLS